MVNDVYKLDKYPNLRTAVREMRAASAEEDCVVISVLPGDFLSPCTLTSLDGGVAMMGALNEASVDYVMFGNHEFDLNASLLQRRVQEFKGTWVNSNVSSPAFVDCQGHPLPEYVVLRVGTRKVAMAGFLLDDMSQFSPLSRPTIEPVNDALLRVADQMKAAEGNIDAFLPMQHLNIKQDRAFAQFLAQHEELKWLADRTPVMLGAHDHEVYIEQAAKSLIFKVGCDCTNIGVVDLWWTQDGTLKRSVHMYDADDFSPDPTAQAFVQRKQDSLVSMLAVPLFEVPEVEGTVWSTERVRFEPEPLVSLLLKVVKGSMQGVELVFLQGGNVRGMCTYPPGPFGYGDLMREFAFDTHMAIVDLPGGIIEDSIRATRTAEGAKPFFLHCDADAVVSAAPDVRFEQINGKPFQRDRTYRVATYQFLLTGLGEIQPLFGYAQEHKLAPNLENCLPIKHYAIETCMQQAWRDMIASAGGPASEGDVPPDQPEVLCDRVRALFSSMDGNGDGVVEPEELSHFLESNGRPASRSLVKFLIDTLDSNSDDRIDLEEMLALVR